MVLKEKELAALIEKYEAEARKNDRNYQETGITRYERQKHKAEDLADTLRVALNALEDHQKMLHYRWTVLRFAMEARETDPGNAGQLIKNILAQARLDDLIG